jgi:diguanylate cyclase (GGDEF)-like protein
VQQHVRRSEREDATVRAFRLVHDVQADVPDALAGLDELSEQGRARGWGEVVGGCLVARAVSAWLRRQPGAGEAVEALVALSSAEGDEVMLALGLALRANDSFADGDPAATTSRDADLARAVVLLEQAEGRPVERITAHTATEIALLNRSLFDLSVEQAHAALAIRPSCPADAVDFLLGPVLFNLAETEVCWAAMLRQLGDRDGVAARWQAWRNAERATTEFAMAPSWRRELAALGLLLTAMAGLDVAERSRRALGELPPDPSVDLRTIAVLRLAVALSDADAGRKAAGREIESAIGALDADAQPHLYDLALHVAAELESRGPVHGAGLRSSRRQLGHHWAKRLSSLGAMQALIRAERQTDQLALLSRHALLDDLTGIGNRRALAEHLATLEAQGERRIALVILDLDNFKEVNDLHGHLAGDAVLTGVARLLEQSVRPVDVAVRLGGDEFAVVLAGVELDAAAERAGELLGRIDRQDFSELGPRLRATMSAGVAVGSPGRLRELWSRADAALYRAKAGEGRRDGRSRLALAPGAAPAEPGDEAEPDSAGGSAADAGAFAGRDAAQADGPAGSAGTAGTAGTPRAAGAAQSGWRAVAISASNSSP